MISGRPNDAFGIGYYYMGIADTKITSPLGFGDSQGVEAFYDVALTPWLHLTPDVQWVRPSQERVNDSWIVGIRLFMAFLIECVARTRRAAWVCLCWKAR
jgi:porin